MCGWFWCGGQETRERNTTVQGSLTCKQASVVTLALSLAPKALLAAKAVGVEPVSTLLWCPLCVAVFVSGAVLAGVENA